MDHLLDIFTPKNLTEAMELAKLIADSDLAPKDYKGKAGNVLIAMAKGAELGLHAMQSLDAIAVINGRATVWGDTAVALVRRHPEFEDMDEGFDETTQTAWCLITRTGQTTQRRTFSMKEAAAANLTSKSGTPWSSGYAKRMCSWRAKSWAMRDVFADALRGLGVREEVAPPEEREIQGEVVKPELPQLPEKAEAAGEPPPAKIVGSDGVPLTKAEKVMQQIGEPGNRFAGATLPQNEAPRTAGKGARRDEPNNGFTPSLEQLQLNLREAKNIEDVNAVIDLTRGCTETVRQAIMQEIPKRIAELKAAKTEEPKP